MLKETFKAPFKNYSRIAIFDAAVHYENTPTFNILKILQPKTELKILVFFIFLLKT